MEYTRLFSPVHIGGMELKNRVVMAAMHLHYTQDGLPNQRLAAYYRRRAAGGVGLIVLGGCRFDQLGGAAGMLRLDDDGCIPPWRDFVRELKSAAPDVKVAAQLFHAGRYARQQDIGCQAAAPSAVYSRYTRQTPRAMTGEDMERIIAAWAAAAARARAAGLDGVEILGSAGYLISQFLSPVTNQRTDEYGGSWENRCRFPLAVIRAVRRAVGEDFPIFLRLGGSDFMPGGNTNAQAAAFAALARQAGVDAFNVTGGWHESAVPQITGEVPRGGFAYLAAGVKGAVDVPVIASNRINTPRRAEEILALGQADLVCLGRALVADPDWCEKARAGRGAEIRRCLACNQGCLGRSFFGKPVACTANPWAGREYLEDTASAAPAPQRILVVGGGPAGCEYALRAAGQGHQVVLWEASNHLGGQVNLAMVPPGKGEFGCLIAYHRAMLDKLGVEVRLGCQATAEDVLRGGFDRVVLAVGSRPRPLALPGDGSVPVYTGDQVLSGAVMPGRAVVIVGGGAAGCEIAHYLADRGAISGEELKFLTVHTAEPAGVLDGLLNRSARRVTLVEQLDRIGNGFDPGVGGPVVRQLRRLGVESLTGARVRAIRDGRVEVEQRTAAGQVTHTLPCDTVVLAAGRLPCRALAEQLEAAGVHPLVIGDAAAVGKVSDAVAQAADLAAALG